MLRNFKAAEPAVGCFAASHNISTTPTNTGSGIRTDLAPSLLSRDTATKSKSSRHPTRSCLDYGRLYLLRNKQNQVLLWKRFVVIAALLLVSTKTIPRHMRMGSQSFEATDHANNPRGTTILHQDVSPTKGSRFDLKPLMVGFLLVPTEDGTVANYNINRRNENHWQKPGTHPRYVLEEFQTVQIDPQSHKIVRGSLKTHWTREPRMVEAIGFPKRQLDIETNSKDYKGMFIEDPPKRCEPQYEWQTTSFPTCNNVHETDILTRVRTLSIDQKPESKILASGFYRDVWLVENSRVGDITVMKTLRHNHVFSVKTMRSNMRDALSLDRLTRSPNALAIYGYCGNSGVFPFANGGTLEDAIVNPEWKTWNSTRKMKYVYQVATAIADVHNIDKEGLASMSHTDISLNQFVSTNNGVDYVINDFNRARFLYREKEPPHALCKFRVRQNIGTFRSPEEYAYKGETEKIDVFSMGNIFFNLLTGRRPLYSLREVEALQEGKRAKIPEQYAGSGDVYVQAILKSIQMCWHQNPDERATSREVEQFLKPFALGKGPL